MRQLGVFVVVFLSGCFGADEKKKQPLLVPVGGNEFTQDLPYNFNFLEPQFQYPALGGFNYVSNKQPSFPRSQPPIILLAGAAPPGQQFLLQQPGAPPGNFLIPQPEGPSVILRGNPNQPGPAFGAGYPKPAFVPPVEKDAEEVPSLAGNHPATGIPTFSARRPEKLETLDEPYVPTEAEDLAPADKNPSAFPKKFPAPQPRLKPGERFFILNGRPLYSNYPVEQQYQPTPTYYPQSDLFYLRPKPEFVAPPRQNYHQVPELFLRNAVTGEISDVRHFPVAPTTPFDHGNFISLNQPADFRHQQGFFVKAAEFEQPKAKTAQPQFRSAKNVQFLNQPTLVPAPHFLPAYGDGYYFADLKSGKDEDDTVVIDAKNQDEPEAPKSPPKKEEEEGSLSQAQPSAIAIAGIGGVAAAGPRGTALAGPKGLAVSSPQATAVAGPKSDEDEEEEKQKKPKPKKEKH